MKKSFDTYFSVKMPKKHESHIWYNQAILTQALLTLKVNEGKTFIWAVSFLVSSTEVFVHSFWFKCLLMVNEFYILKNVKRLSRLANNQLWTGSEI
jgi:hypothetical protein